MAQTHADDWDQHWDDFAEVAEQNPAQDFRRRLVHEHLGPISRGAHLVDLGSGQGDLVEELARLHPDAEVLGIEYSQTGVDIGARKAPRAAFLQRDLTDPAPAPPPFVGWATHATCAEVLEHVDDPVALLRNAMVYCAPGCRLVVTVPGGPRSAFDVHIGHRRHYDAASLRQVLLDAGLRVETVEAVGFPFFNLYRLVVVARGRKLAEDVSVLHGGSVSRLAAAVMRIFHGLLSLPLRGRRWGWQMVAVAVWPGPSGA